MSHTSLQAERRRRALRDILERDGGVDITASATELGVSAMTIRRDLEELERSGLARRVRGGALPRLGPRSFAERQARAAKAKAAIAEKALSLVPATGAIALDASSTAGTLAARLGAHDELTVATNSWHNFGTVRRTVGPRPVLIGGEPEERTDSFVGPVAARAATALLYARFFVSASAIDADHGSSDVSLAEAHIKQQFSSAAEETILLIDSSKLEQRDMALSFPWEEVDLLVTELDPGSPRLDAYRERTALL